jgi:predicted nucleic acid-binding protein
VVRNIAMLDTNVLILLLLRTVPRFNNANRRLRNYHSQIQINTELIHQSILDEVRNFRQQKRVSNMILFNFLTMLFILDVKLLNCFFH